jgi:hypothetical protein
MAGDREIWPIDIELTIYDFRIIHKVKIKNNLILGSDRAMQRGLQGHYVTISTAGESARAFVPAPLPPTPPIEWTADLQRKFNQAHLALGKLDSIADFLPDISLFLYMFVLKEAVLSSMIEGTQSSLSDLLLFELDLEPGVALDDVREVSNYVAALDHGLQRLAGGFPLSLRLIREMHGVLLSKGKGAGQTPGEFRRSQNWIGGTRPGNAAFVPPPADQVMPCNGATGAFSARGHHPGAAQGGTGSCAVRVHPSVFGRQRPAWPAADHADPLRTKNPAGTPAVSEPIFQSSPAALLRPVKRDSENRGLGALA